MFVIGRMFIVYLKDLNALRILMNFLMNLFRWKRGWDAPIHVYVWEHIASLYYRTT